MMATEFHEDFCHEDVPAEDGIVPCPRCDGDGDEIVGSNRGDGWSRPPEPITATCRLCAGKGHVTRNVAERYDDGEPCPIRHRKVTPPTNNARS